MFLPIGHDMSARRWPVVTIALIVINFIAFALTYKNLEMESPELGKVKEHILRLAAMHPELDVPEEARDMVEKYHKAHPDEWALQSRENRQIADAWDMRIRGLASADVLTTSELQSEMNALVDEYVRLRGDSILEKYAFVPAHPTAISYISATFLHGGWLHILSNMWFFWLAGVLLEDLWGRIVYPIFYILAGIAALLAHAFMNSGSLTPCLGASGAVAGLMGAFMVRFPKRNIKVIGWVFRFFSFSAPAIVLLPLWVISEIFLGIVWAGYDGIGHWAHVGGFVFGVVGAFAVQFTGLENKMNQAIVEKINDNLPETFEAQQLMDEGEFNAAEIALKDILETKPGCVEVLLLLQKVYWRKNDMQQYQETTLSLCQAYLKVRDLESAWQSYEEFLNSGGQAMPPAAWLDVTRLAEETQRYERAIDECEKLIATFPGSREALMAQMRAGRICQKQLVQPQKALLFFEAAYTSTVPHLDLEQTIAAGIRECKAAISLTSVGRSTTAG